MQILAEMAQALKKHRVRPLHIVLSPAKYVSFYETFYSLRRDSVNTYGTKPALMFHGIPVVREDPTGFCRGCGAPAEPNVCSFCKLPSEYIRLE